MNTAASDPITERCKRRSRRRARRRGRAAYGYRAGTAVPGFYSISVGQAA